MAEQKKQPPRHDIQHIHLEELEAASFLRDSDRAGRAMMECFRRLRMGSEFVGLPYLEEEIARSRYFARLAAAITALILDPEFHPSDAGYERLLIEHGVIDGVFETSAFDSSDHLARLLSDNPLEKDPTKFRYEPEKLAKWFILHGMSSNIQVNFDELFGHTRGLAQTMFPVWAAMIGQQVILTAQAHDKREMLLTMAHWFEDLPIVPDMVMAPLADAYMHCSYAVSPTRHDVKGTINRLMARSLQQTQKLPTDELLLNRRAQAVSTGSTEASEYRENPTNYREYLTKPTMLVPLEHFGSFHAMYRCYAPIMRQLRPYFRMIAVARPSAMDETSRGCFDDVMALPEGHIRYDDIIAGIAKHGPDIIYYPSLGMAAQWVGLSSIRLAPIQVMTLGHPATSMSPAMDYVVSDGDHCDPELWSERIVRVPADATYFEKRPDIPERRLVGTPAGDGLVRVAVSAMVLKLNVPFLQCLLRISDRAEAEGIKVQYYFFPSQLGLAYWQARKHLKTWFPNCMVQPRADYAWYMDRLRECDLSLVPFPFGGTNSTVDALWLSIPVVTLLGQQAHSRFDAMILERVGCGMWVASTKESYEALALGLILEASERAAVTANLVSHDLDALLFAEPKGEAAGSYGKAFWHIFTHHEAIQQSENRIITWEEIKNGG